MSEIMEVDSPMPTNLDQAIGKRASGASSKKENRIMKPGRMFVKGVFIGYRRGRHKQRVNQSLIKIDGVFAKEEARWYLGKKCAYVYRAKNKERRAWQRKPTRLRVMWGKVINTHGNSGVVRTRFKRNLPPAAMGKRIRVMLYPHRA